MSRIVIAIGGNAILNPAKGDPKEQKRMIDETCGEIARIVKSGYEVVLTHGNGPQIGNILAMQEECGLVQPQTLDICGAQTQGMLGYTLQQSLGNKISEIGLKKEVVTLLTQVLIDATSPSFENPTKPIGLYYPEQLALGMMARGVRMTHDKKGYRKVVPSPMPLKIVEMEAINELISRGMLVIAGGGGGIPVVLKNDMLEGVEAVIDKDLTGSILASLVGAEIFLILTDVENASLNYGKENQVNLHEIYASEAEKYLKEGHFGKGSMEPKILAALNFIKSGGRLSIITSLELALPALFGTAGTRIIA